MCCWQSFSMCLILPYFQGRWDSTVSIVIRLWAIQPRVSVLAGARDLSILQNIQSSSAAQPASNSMGTRSSLLRGKVARACSWPFTAESKNNWSYTSTPPIGYNILYNKFTFSYHIFKLFYYVPYLSCLFFHC